MTEHVHSSETVASRKDQKKKKEKKKKTGALEQLQYKSAEHSSNEALKMTASDATVVTKKFLP